MFNVVVQYLPVLAVTMLVNMILGMYYNIGVFHENFDWKKMLQGVIKALIVAVSFIGLAYCFDATKTIIDIGALEVNPELIMTSAISIYLVKDTITLANILKVNTNKPDDLNSGKNN